MARKKLTPEDIKIHVDSIYSFLEEEKPLSEIIKFNSRFAILKSILLKKKIISLRKQKNSKKRNIYYFKATPSFVIFPKDYEDMLQVYQKIIKEQNQKSVDNIENRFIKKVETKKDVKSIKPIKKPLDLTYTKIWFGTDSKLSKRVQEKMFKLGWKWNVGGQNIEKINSLYFGYNKSLQYGIESKRTFNSDPYTEIFESDLFPEKSENIVEPTTKVEDLKFSEQELDNIIEKYKKGYYDQEKQIESLKNQQEFSKEKIVQLENQNKKYITEYSAFINEKLIEIEQLKQELHQQKSQKNQISVIKIFGIPLIKKTTKTIK